jgi:hypothetical protein
MPVKKDFYYLFVNITVKKDLAEKMSAERTTKT